MSRRWRQPLLLTMLVASLFEFAVLEVCPAQSTSQSGLQAPPLSPEDSLESLHIRPGYAVELVAAEPLVVDPTAIDWGPDGSLWVAEMADYPLGLDGRGQPGGRIRRLLDSDGDGRYDQSILFLTGIRFPTGILAWQDGVLVTAAPEIFFAKDTDNDGVADVRETLYSGFLEGNQQLRVNGLRRGLDNWIYCASGSHHAGYGSDSQILSHQTGERILLGSRDFRIRPDTGAIDPQSGPSQYGRNRDDWGNWFGVQNSHPLWHYVLADQDIRRNPHFAPPDPRVQVVTPTNPRVYPIKESQKRFHSFHHADRFTSACSAMIYRDSLLFPADAVQHAFTCEPFHSLVQHNVIVERGVSFTSERDPAETDRDFFASSDRWCRPVMARTGPDGAVWIVDMYRYMIEHPHWLPQEGQDELRPFFRAGDDRGRIYRIYPERRLPRKVPRIDRMTLPELVATLSSENGWQRDVAQYQLVAFAGSPNQADAVKLLRELFDNSRNPRARLHALCALDGLAAVAPDTLHSATNDPHPAVRRHAVRLAAARNVDYGVLERMLYDDDHKVRLQLASALGDLSDPRAAQGLAVLAIENAQDSMVTAAVMSSLNQKNVGSLLEMTVARQSSLPGPFVETVYAQVASFSSPKLISKAVDAITTSEEGGAGWKYAALASMLDAFQRANRPTSEAFTSPQQDRLIQVVNEARRAAKDPAGSEQDRASAVRLLFRPLSQEASDGALAEQLLMPQVPLRVQQATVSQINRQADEQLAATLLDGWKSHSPALRTQILQAVTSRGSWSAILLDAVESGRLLPSEIDASARRRLSANKDAAHIARVDRLLAAETPGDRRLAIQEYQSALELDGDRERGKAVFAKRCATCHRLENVGFEVGPNLASLTDKSPRSLLISILDPSAVIEGKYLDYLVVDSSGRTWNGILATETGSNITLLAADGKRESILRNEIETMQSSGKSLMPDGLEKDISPQEMADLLEFMK